MRSTPHDGYRARPGRAAFTLVELLVVVSIIALLISILLPSLSTAREQAKTVACMALQSGLGRGFSTYQSEWNGWLAGSPGTSGSVLLGKSTPADFDAVDTPTERIQVWDWMTPLGLFKSWNAHRGKRWEAIVSKFVCPKNQFLSDPFRNGAIGPTADWPTQPMTSYNTTRQYMGWAGDIAGQASGAKPPFPEAAAASMIFGLGPVVTVPSSYTPRVERVGNPSEHIYISDSCRFTIRDENAGLFVSDHDVNWNGRWGGGFCDGGPTIPEEFMRAFHVSGNPRHAGMPPLTYRHKRGKQIGIVVSYYDGHGSYMTEKQSRWPDPWWPKGSGISNSEMNNPTQRLVEEFFDERGWYVIRK